MNTRGPHLRLLLTVGGLVAIMTLPSQAQLTELAYYRMGESDTNSAAGQLVDTTIDEIGFADQFRDMDAVFDLEYSGETPPDVDSTRSIAFNGDGYLVTAGTPWHNLYPGYRVGMEAFVKVDPGLEGYDAELFGNGSLYHMSVGADGYYHANQATATLTPVEYGQWQHVAFWTTGSYWQIYVDGEPQFDSDALPNFTYGGGGDATVGAGQNGEQPFEGLIDEYRIFTWTGPFNPSDLLYFQQRPQGDINEDGRVDGADYDIWRTNVGADLGNVSRLEGRALGDLNVDGQINLDDFALIKANLTPGVAAAAMIPVPEPAAGVLLLIAVAAGAMCHRRTRGVRG